MSLTFLGGFLWRPVISDGILLFELDASLDDTRASVLRPPPLPTFSHVSEREEGTSSEHDVSTGVSVLQFVERGFGLAESFQPRLFVQDR